MTNNTFRVVIVEDEAPARRELLSMLGRHPDIEIAGIAETAREAVAVIQETRPNGVFLDVQLPDGSGFDVLKNIPGDTPVIFATAYDRYALRAFEINALDYLLKPVDPDRLVEAVRRLQLGCPASEHNDLPEDLKSDDTLYLQLDHGRRMLRVDMIVAIEADGDYSMIHLRDGRDACVRHTIKRWEERLPADRFVRIHRSTIINLDYLIEVERIPGGGRAVRLENMANTLPVSRSHSVILDRALDEKLG